jgi:hypothetical protein
MAADLPIRPIALPSCRSLASCEARHGPSPIRQRERHYLAQLGLPDIAQREE